MDLYSKAAMLSVHLVFMEKLMSERVAKIWTPGKIPAANNWFELYNRCDFAFDNKVNAFHLHTGHTLVKIQWVFKYAKTWMNDRLFEDDFFQIYIY